MHWDYGIHKWQFNIPVLFCHFICWHWILHWPRNGEVIESFLGMLSLHLLKHYCNYHVLYRKYYNGNITVTRIIKNILELRTTPNFGHTFHPRICPLGTIYIISSMYPSKNAIQLRYCWNRWNPLLKLLTVEWVDFYRRISLW